MSRAWMPLYVADYLADTRHLSGAEHGAYMLLIMHYWQNGGLPKDEIRLARICLMDEASFASSIATLHEFFDSEWRHPRIDAELAIAAEKYQKRAQAGQKGGRGKALSKQCSSNATAMLYQSQSQSQSQLQLPTEKKENSLRSSKKKPAIPFPDNFVPDETSMKAVTAVGMNGVDIEMTILTMRDWAKSRDERKPDWQAAFRYWIRNDFKRRNTNVVPIDWHKKREDDAHAAALRGGI